MTAEEIGAAAFRDFLATHPTATMELLQTVVARLRSSDRRRVEFGGFETTARLAHLLAELVDEPGVPDFDGERDRDPVLAGRAGSDDRRLA